MNSTTAHVATTATLIGGPTLLLEFGGARFLIDPTFDPPGPHPVGARTLIKTSAPALAPEELGPIDAVLLSHDQHPDNLDDAGRKVVAGAALTLTTEAAAERLGGTATGLAPWHHFAPELPDLAPDLRITAVPAQHGPSGTEHISGPVIGFVLSGAGLPTVYISGDNASLPLVQEIAHHAGPIDLAVLFAGAARSPLLDAYLTLTADQVAEAAAILGARKVAVIHTEGWAHLTEAAGTVTAAFARHGRSDRLVALEPGRPTPL